ncbi:hypothetical protein DUNSADRAFT_14152 [Dunaliella salina]|uniref:Peptidase C45 hydrolase domain-containing protein n=1 Tax=Dunaliella salina TaxID=3046 RepID=A0ABQ7H2R7_DUNSA|nr:hypothetical protein DUNSADRAFT_14152 [Dunaliella salina]|eukprot:KAF5841149.1 hypothetical protein DUNSADRAFT_14152 [Dunaliella salina]
MSDQQNVVAEDLSETTNSWCCCPKQFPDNLLAGPENSLCYVLFGGGGGNCFRTAVNSLVYSCKFHLSGGNLFDHTRSMLIHVHAGHFLLLAACLSSAGAEVLCRAHTRLSLHGRFPLLQIANYTSYYELGLCQGQAFRSIIRGRAEQSDTLVRMQAFAETLRGSELLQQMKELHRQLFADYMQELEGIADGALLPLDTVFLLNLRTEFPQLQQPTEPQDSSIASEVNAGPHFLQTQQAATQGQGGELWAKEGLVLELEEEGCSDVLVHFGKGHHSMNSIARGTLWMGGPNGRWGEQDETQQEEEPWPLIAHNEDVGSDAVGRLYFVRAEQQRHTWLALCYAGELASTAFAASKEPGIAFTLNALYPSPEALKLPGVGRNFISRKLIDAPTFEGGIDVLRSLAQATGRSLNVLQTSPLRAGQRRKLLNIETAPGIGSSSIVEIQPASWLFHANAYQRLPVPEQPGQSSPHREKVAAQYGDSPLKDGPKEALWILGDTSDATWPIYRDGTSPVDSGFTECTILIMAPPSHGGQRHDSKGRRITATVFDGNPRLGNSVVSFDLSETLMPI